MKEFKVYCRREPVDGLVHALRQAGVVHTTVTHVRSLGSGVDPKRAGVCWETGTLYSENAKLERSGQYEALERVKARLEVVVPITLAVIALLLYLNFGTLTQTLMVMLSLPFALIGGVWAMSLLNYNLSIAVAVGFIALAGVAAETGAVMLLYLDHAWEDLVRDGHRPTRTELVGAIEHGVVNRLRPKLMTVAAIMFGLLPALWSHGTGAEVMQRIAAPMVGGMVTSTVLTLVVIPVLYFLWRSRGLAGSPDGEGGGFHSKGSTTTAVP